MQRYSFKVSGSPSSDGKSLYECTVVATDAKGAFLAAYKHFGRVEEFEAQKLIINSSRRLQS